MLEYNGVKLQAATMIEDKSNKKRMDLPFFSISIKNFYMKDKKNPLENFRKLWYTFRMKIKEIIVIGGPTASGKTSFAVQLAKEIGGQIINADAVQVYQDLQILSARPTKEEEQGVLHYLFGYVDAWTTPSVQDWLNDVAGVLDQTNRPVFVGGTGFYIDALINGLSEIPDVPEEIRTKVRAMDIEEVLQQVEDVQFTDPQRLRRALEVQLATGKSLEYFQKQPKKKVVDADFKLIHLLPPKEFVYARCEQRLVQMLQQGMIEEVQKLLSLHPTGGVLKAIGVPEISAMLDGKITKQEMMQKILLATRHYAKRQMTWFRHQGRPDFILNEPKPAKMLGIIK